MLLKPIKCYEILLKRWFLACFERSRGHIRLCLISSGFRGIEKTRAEWPPYAHGKIAFYFQFLSRTIKVKKKKTPTKYNKTSVSLGGTAIGF